MKHLFAALFFSFIFVQNFQASSGKYYGGEDISPLQASEPFSKKTTKVNSKFEEEVKRIKEKRKEIKEIDDKIKRASIVDTIIRNTTKWKKKRDELKMELGELQKALIRNHMTVSIWRIKIANLKDRDGKQKKKADIVINYFYPNTRIDKKLINRDNCGSTVDLQFKETEIHADACLEFRDVSGLDKFITTISLNELYQKAKFQIEEEEKFSNEGTYEVKIEGTTYIIFYKTRFKK